MNEFIVKFLNPGQGLTEETVKADDYVFNAQLQSAAFYNVDPNKGLRTGPYVANYVGVVWVKKK